MTTVPCTSLWLPPADQPVHALLQAPAAPRGAVLVVPPLLHEQQRSHRLFAALATALAVRGIATLRFDYRGCGDSAGDDQTFLPSGGMADMQQALDALRSRVRAPTAVLAVRAGALLAGSVPRPAGVPLWLWQPTDDGARYLDELRERHRQACSSRRRYPFLGRSPVAGDGELMGYRLHAKFAEELARLPCPTEAALRIDAATQGAHPDIELPPALSRWVDELEIAGVFPWPTVQAVADRLAATFDPP